MSDYRAREIKDALEPAIFKAIDDKKPLTVTLPDIDEPVQLRGIHTDDDWGWENGLIVYCVPGGFRYAHSSLMKLAYEEEIALWEQLEALADRQRSEHE